jgi:hypothetical protein
MQGAGLIKSGDVPDDTPGSAPASSLAWRSAICEDGLEERNEGIDLLTSGGKLNC